MNFVLKISPQSSFSSGKFIKNHFALFANLKDDFIIVSTDPYLDNRSLIGKKISNIPWYSKTLINDIFITYNGKDYVPYVKNFDNGMILIFCIPRSEMFYTLVNSLRVMIALLFLLGILISTCLYLSLNKYVMKPINILTNIASKIGKGEDVEIKIEKPEEFAHLASTFDKMTGYIKQITKDKEKINSELSIAKSIQTSSLPNEFFPERTEFDIYATMKPAREVGGDFYDFYFIDDENIMFLIADVSGKGVPAALFMMTVKTMINNLSQIGYPPQKLISLINKKICETNKQGFFVTMFSAIVNIKSGKMYLVNCGHNQPLLKRKNGKFEYLDLAPNIVLGAFDDSEFEVRETKLEQGDILFAYTDGVTEAMNANNELYGEKRLQTILNKNEKSEDIKEILTYVDSDITTYTGSTEQSDDITMIIFKLQGDKMLKTFKNKATIENYKPFYTWLHDVCIEWGVGEELLNKIDMCAEEIYANIAFYAYQGKDGDINISLEKINNELVLKFEDNGFEYNPLEKPDPDITLPPEERPLGGLGIFMVKKLVDAINYERINDKNMLTMKFYL
jgi:sigma-B regulation protein RsbU (phosphoserine phosphatase)